ncbi:sulfurtransferase [Halomarina oriensis]|uniref:Sulfurtransferase n=1 Tax=Halomarina oriensis TaxID=671145 RepID=A0A6B0GJT2_9EURY|nr:rhodanese-like domain-containing protein [Halomarina oriensis]MWG34860.1 sulfurtransferase [Halomarina oriensis]
MDFAAADWVESKGDELHRVDVREDWEYDGIGHLPEAVNVPFDSYRADAHAADGGEGEAGMLPGAERFAEVMGAAGISRDDGLVAYDDTHGVFAARLLVTCELYGHDPDHLHLLDGDYSSWVRDYPTSQETVDPDPATYEARFDPDGPLVQADVVEAALDDPDAVVVDTREGWEYDEAHLPGAVRLDWQELVDGDTRGLRPTSELRDLLEERGIDPEGRVVLYCNTARRISHTYVALRQLGYADLAFYEGSLTEWEEEGRPLESNERAE